jgi:Cu/Ag efflux pump CusA
MVFWPGEGSQVAIRVSGDQLHQIRQTADQLLIRLSEIDGVVDLHSSITMKPRVDIQVDRRKCTALGLKLADVMQIIKMYQEGIEVEGLKIAGRPAFLMLPQSERNPFIGLGELSLTNGMGQRVPLRTVAAAQPLDGPRSLYREAGKNCIVVSCNIHGRTLAQVRQEVRKIAQELSTKEARIQVE